MDIKFIVIISTLYTVKAQIRLSAFSDQYVNKEFYLRLRNSDPLSEVESKLEVGIKELICKDILQGIQQTTDNEETPVRINDSDFEMRQINVTWEREDPTQEHAFICHARDLQSEKITKYFVSKEYNVNGQPDSSKYVAGRFVFHSKDDDRIIFDGLAEEPAKLVNMTESEVENLYIQRVEEHNGPAKDYTSDPLCKLEKRERFRICSLVFSGPHFNADFKFSSKISFHSRGSSIYENYITFLTSDAKKRISRFHKEWMIGCEGKEDRRGEYIYFLSQAYAPNEVFVLSSYDFKRFHDVKITHLFTDVTFRT